MASVLTSQGTEVLKIGELVVTLRSDHAKLEAVVAGIGQESCHCRHVADLCAVSKLHDETLRKDHAPLEDATKRIQGAEQRIHGT